MIVRCYPVHIHPRLWLMDLVNFPLFLLRIKRNESVPPSTPFYSARIKNSHNLTETTNASVKIPIADCSTFYFKWII